MAESGDTESNNCFSGILRRILCRGSLPTHPSDQFIQKPENSTVKQTAVTWTNPGVVARLMGLDSFPDTPLYPRDRALGSYFRSRSANSIDFFSKFDLTKERRASNNQHQHHRRVLTSVSFRQGLIDDDYNVVLHLDKVDQTHQELMIKHMPKVNCQEMNKDKGVRIQKNEKLQQKSVNNKLEIEEQRRLGCGKFQKKDLKERRSIIKPVEPKEAISGSSKKYVKKKNDKILGNKVHNSDRKLHPESSTPAEVPLRSKKTLASQIANSTCSYSIGAHRDNIEELRAITYYKSKAGKRLKNGDKCYYKRMVEEIYKLTKEDVEDDWVQGKFEEVEEICQQFGQEILEVLSNQFVDELLVILYGTSE